jgi:membrane-associated phospholipid phosphatase
VHCRPTRQSLVTLFDKADRALALAVNQFAGRSVVIDKLVGDVGQTGLLNGGVLIAAIYWLWFEGGDETAIQRQKHNIATALLAVMVVACAVWILKATLPFRPRPLNDLDLGLRLPFGADPTSINALGAFPSGHAAFFFALCVPLWIRSRRLGAVAAVWIALVVCLPLLYLGDHWPSDIVAGALVGVALMLFFCRIIRATTFPDRVVNFSATHPQAFYTIAWLCAFEMALLFGDIQAYFANAARIAGALFLSVL